MTLVPLAAGSWTFFIQAICPYSRHNSSCSLFQDLCKSKGTSLLFLLARNICYGRLCSDQSVDIRFLLALASAGLLSCSRYSRPGRRSAEAAMGVLRRPVFMRSMFWTSREPCCWSHSELVPLFRARSLPYVETSHGGIVLVPESSNPAFARKNRAFFPGMGLSLILLLFPESKLCVLSLGLDVSKGPS